MPIAVVLFPLQSAPSSLLLKLAAKLLFESVRLRAPSCPSTTTMVSRRRPHLASPLSTSAIPWPTSPDGTPLPLLALGLEGSANKLGVGLILHSPPPPHASSSKGKEEDPASVTILSNIRHTYVTPPGEGFLPSDTARHHKRWIGEVVEKALKEAGRRMEEVHVVCYTKGECVFVLGARRRES